MQIRSAARFSIEANRSAGRRRTYLDWNQHRTLRAWAMRRGKLPDQGAEQQNQYACSRPLCRTAGKKPSRNGSELFEQGRLLSSIRFAFPNLRFPVCSPLLHNALNLVRNGLQFRIFRITLDVNSRFLVNGRQVVGGGSDHLLLQSARILQIPHATVLPLRLG